MGPPSLKPLCNQQEIPLARKLTEFGHSLTKFPATFPLTSWSGTQAHSEQMTSLIESVPHFQYQAIDYHKPTAPYHDTRGKCPHIDQNVQQKRSCCTSGSSLGHLAVASCWCRGWMCNFGLFIFKRRPQTCGLNYLCNLRGWFSEDHRTPCSIKRQISRSLALVHSPSLDQMCLWSKQGRAASLARN